MVECSNSKSVRKDLADSSPPRTELLREGRSSDVIYGKASYYGKKFHGRKTANGEIFDMNGLTAAHRALPFGTLCRITNLENDKEVTVRINDRGPFVYDRVIDLSQGAAFRLDGISSGVIDVKIEVLKLGEQED
jgi:rare lipoprotein A